jgi:hypothetical protein
LICEQEFLKENISNAGIKLRDVIHQVFVHVTWILPVDFSEGELAVVIKLKVPANRIKQHHILGMIINTLGQAIESLEHRIFSWLQKAVKAAQNDEGQDDLAVLGLLKIATKNFSNRPSERSLGFVLWHWSLLVVLPDGASLRLLFYPRINFRLFEIAMRCQP